MRFIRILVFSYFLCTGCCINEPYESENTGAIISQFGFGLDVMNCIDTRDIVIRDSNSFYQFIKELEDCDYNRSKAFDISKEINFDKYTIIGKKTIVDGCNGYVARYVEFFDDKKEVLYTIERNTCGSCNDKVGFTNLVLVPRIPFEYNVIISEI